MSLLTLQGLSAFYGASPALRGIDLAVAEGGVTALLGANGAGKTTTLKAVCGLVRTEGRITFEGAEIAGSPTESIVRRGIALVPEGRGTFVEMSVAENLRLGAITRRGPEVRRDMDRLLGYFPRLGERLGQQAGTLSGGEQQQLAIARALMLRPRLMLLDEPSFGVAPLVVKDIFGILRRIAAEERVSMLIVEQNARLALDLADHAYLLETGRIVLQGTAADMRADEGIQRSYLGH